MLVNAVRFRSRLAEEGLDGIVAATSENVQYLTGIASVSLAIHPYFGQCYAVATHDRPEAPSFVSSAGEVDQVLDGFDGIARVETYGTFYREMAEGTQLSDDEQRLHALSDQAAPPSPVEALAAAIRGAGLSEARIGIDNDGLKPGVRETLQGLLPAATFVDASKTFAFIRRVKSEEEVRRIRRSAIAAQNAILAATSIAEEGVSERELMLAFNRSIAAQGGWPRLAMIRIGRNGVGGQVRPGSTKLAKGDTIWFDVGCVKDGYWSDIARNVAFGEPPARSASIYRALKAGEDAAIDAVRPGQVAHQVFDMMMEATREAGLPDYRRHHVGHGIGAEIYEQPILAPGNETPIEAGMVLNVETPYYEFGTGGLHVEDPFVVGESGGNQLLTTLSRDMLLIEP